MMLLLTFGLAFVFSFLGSIPPGTLNVTIVQLGLEKKMDAAWRFAIAAALIEYPYAWLSIEFENVIVAYSLITDNIKLITGIVMILLGAINLLSSERPGKIYQHFNESGFRRGVILSLLNPFAIPFWIGVTAYLKSLQWIDLSSPLEMHCYLAGVSLGVFVLLILLAHLANKIGGNIRTNTLLRKIPGIILIALGSYALLRYVL